MTERAAESASCPPAVELWFDFGSTYSYLSVMRIEEAAARRGVRLSWRPFLLGPIFKSFGWNTSPFVLQPEKGEYVWEDLRRQSAKYGLAWKRPVPFPRSTLLPMRIAAAFAEEDWAPGYCRKMMGLIYGEGREVDSVDVVSEVLAGLGLPVEAVLAQAQTDAKKLRLRENTQQAQVRRIFGAPTFMVGREMFWGNDRMEDALDLAQGRARPG